MTEALTLTEETPSIKGLSYASILKRVAKALNREESELNVIICHLGSGASICAVSKGRSLDTTMGLTPLEGLPGATRSGSVDPALGFHICEERAAGKIQEGDLSHGLSLAEVVLNKHSGWTAVAGTSKFEDICAYRRFEDMDDGQCALAFEMFADRIIGHLGGLYCK